ncbi:MAG TPA: SMC family ATPase [Gemmatimonadales bacterium]|nr:SMC family ATPase [Gemmatimonadales bacterium]
MQLHRLRLVNFRQHADTDIVLGSGMTAIIGPNGAGKTTLLEAIAWAFFGTPAARGTRESLRRLGAPARSPVRVEVEFTLGAHEYRAVRAFHQAELYQDANPAAVVSGQQEVTARMQRLLGMTRDEFFNTYFTGQKELTVMAQMGPAERARFLSRVLGYEKLREAQDLLRERRAVLRAERGGLEQGLGDERELERELASCRERLDAARRAVAAATQRHAGAEALVARVGPAWTRMAELRESVLALDGERRLAQQHVEEARREFQRLDRELADALSARSALQNLEPQLAVLGELRQELERLDRESEAAGQRRDLLGQGRELEAQLAHARARLAERLTAEAGRRAAEAALAAAQEERRAAESEEERIRTGWVRDRQDAETKRQALLDQYQDLKTHRARITEAGADGACPTCLRPLGQEYQGVLDTLGRQLEEIAINGRFFQQRMKQLAAEPAELREALARRVRATAALDAVVEGAARAAALERERLDLVDEVARLEGRAAVVGRDLAALPEGYDAELHERVRNRLKELEPVQSQATALRVRAERAEQLVRDAEAAERALSERESRLARLAETIAAAGFSDEAFNAAREQYEAAAAGVRQAELDLATVDGDRKVALAALEQVERRQRERAARTQQLEQLKVDLRLHDELDRCFQDLRTELNAHLRPELSEVASAFLSDLTDGRYGEMDLDEEYRILVLEDGVAKPVISGGEEDVANLVLRIAISQLVADRAGQPLSLLVLDEVFGGLDDSRREQVLTLLRRLADRFPQVIVITHLEAVRDGVDRVLRVTFDPTRGLAEVSEDQGGGSRPREDVAA